MRTGRFNLGILVLFTILTPCLWAQDGLPGALSGFKASEWPAFALSSQRVLIGDFDNDQKPDGAILLREAPKDGRRTFRIALHLSAEPNHDLTFISDEHDVSISILDVNRDGTPDIVVEEAFTHKRLQVWLNSGHGSFREVRNDDYPSDNRDGNRWKAPTLNQDTGALCISSRAGTDARNSNVVSQRLHINSNCHNVWPGVLLAQRWARAPNPPRGPPSFFPL
jgi:hypothetical protein